MNEYSKHKLLQFQQSFIDRRFDQDDVALLIVLVRDYTAKGSIFRELGDFLAHPDDKDRGLVLNSVRIAAASVEKDHDQIFYNADFKPPVFNGMGTLEELMVDLCAVFKLVDKSVPIFSRNDANFRDFVFCVIFLLSACRIKHERRLFELRVKYSHGLSLYISYESTNYPRHFVTLPVLFLANVWIESAIPFGSPKYELKMHIARRFEEGMLAAIPYTDDFSSGPRRAADFASGKIWPLPDIKKR